MQVQLWKGAYGSARAQTDREALQAGTAHHPPPVDTLHAVVHTDEASAVLHSAVGDMTHMHAA